MGVGEVEVGEVGVGEVGAREVGVGEGGKGRWGRRGGGKGWREREGRACRPSHHQYLPVIPLYMYFCFWGELCSDYHLIHIILSSETEQYCIPDL